MLRAEGFEFETSIGSLMSLVSKHTQSKIHKKKKTLKTQNTIQGLYVMVCACSPSTD